MSTDKLQALHSSLAEVLSEPPSPPTFFDKEPYDTAQAGERTSDNLRRASEVSRANFGKLTSRELGISPTAMREAGIVHDPKNESLNIARQAFAEQTALATPADAGKQRLFKRSYEAASAGSDSQTANVNQSRSAISGNRIPLGGWALRGIAGTLLAATIGAALVTWSGSFGDATKSTPSQSAPPAQVASTAAVSPEVLPLLQSMARDLTNAGKEIELLKAGRELMVRENAKLNEQFKASQEELTRAVAQLSGQLKASQEQLVRDNANAAEQTKRIQDQLARVISETSEQNARLRLVAASPRPVAPTTRKPAPTLALPQVPGQPKSEKPRSSSASRPSASTR